jgi:hypothetical protein
LDTKCPHIVRTFKLFYKSTFGRLHPFTHANKGLTLCNILYYCCEQRHFVRLTIAFQDALNFGFLWFPKLCQCQENISQCQQDLLGLVQFYLQLKNLVVEKIQQFMFKIVHRAISYLFILGMAKELEDMWCNVDVGHNYRPIMYQVFASLLFHLHFFLQIVPLIEISHIEDCFQYNYQIYL